MDGPLVSIVTPVLNGVRFLPDLIASICAQDYPTIEHIVIDGGSTDGTIELLERSAGTVWWSGRDQGMYDAINRGFRMARGEILAYQNSDDRYVVPDGVSAAVTYLVRHPELDLCYGRFRFVDGAGRPSGLPSPRGRDFDASALRRYNYVPPHATFVRRRVVDEGHWLDPTFHFAGDWEWMVRMAAAGKRFGFVDKVLAEFRRHDRSKTSTMRIAAKVGEWRRVCDRHGLSLAVLLYHELFYAPMRRYIGLRT